MKGVSSARENEQTDANSARPPRRWTRFEESYPEVAAAYEQLRRACADAGPLDERTTALVKLAVSIGRGSSRSVHAHTRKALRAGVSPAELRHAVLIALPTIGLPATFDAAKWVEESIEEAGDSADAPPTAARRPTEGT